MSRCIQRIRLLPELPYQVGFKFVAITDSDRMLPGTVVGFNGEMISVELTFKGSDIGSNVIGWVPA